MYATSESITGFEYSGRKHKALPAMEFQQMFVNLTNNLMRPIEAGGVGDPGNRYGVVLQNWYEPQHYVGLHADDETVRCQKYSKRKTS
mgnify:FL=1